MFLLKRRNENKNLKKQKILNPTITQVVVGTTSASIAEIKIKKYNKNKNIFNTTPSDDVLSLNKDTLGAIFPNQKIRKNIKPIGISQIGLRKETDWYKGSFFSLGKFRKELPIIFCRRTSDFDARNYKISFRQNSVEMKLQKLLYTSGKNKRKSQAFLLCFLLTTIGPIRGILRPLRRYLKSNSLKLRKILIRKMLGIYNGNSVIESDLKIATIHRRLQDATHYCSEGKGSTEPSDSVSALKPWKTRRSNKTKKAKYFRSLKNHVRPGNGMRSTAGNHPDPFGLDEEVIINLDNDDDIGF